MVFTGNIRLLKDNDYNAWEPLWKGYCDFYGESISPEVTKTTWIRLLKDNEPMFGLIAEDKSGKLIGFTHYILHHGTWSEKPICYLEDLFVSSDSRNLGAGRALIETVINKSREQGWRKVYWQTNKDNANARALYEKFTSVSGWVIYEVKT